MIEHLYNAEDVKDYRHATEKQILHRAQELLGLTLKTLLTTSSFLKPSRETASGFSIQKHGKGIAGQLIEEYGFGIKPNQDPNPDFTAAGIELKTIPLTKRTLGLAVKERTKICSIDYVELLKQKWETSHAKRKLEKVLFIYYLYEAENVMQSVIKQSDLWCLSSSADAPIIQDDWTLVWRMVEAGRAHEISESMGRILGAATSGQGRGRDLVRQPIQTIQAAAPRRAFALKPCFTQQRWREVIEKKPYESIVANLRLKITDFESFKKEVLARLNHLSGISVAALAEKYRIKTNEGKNAVATILKKTLGFKNVNSRIKEFEQLGIEVRVVPVRPSDFCPWEAVSFPAFRLKDFETEEWDESELLGYLDRILFIPILFNEKKADLCERKVGQAFFWSPSSEEWRIIKREWEMYQKEVRDGKCKIIRVKGKEVTGLTKGSATTIIHIRPHAVDHNDRDEDSHGNKPVKQSFWLNKEFVHHLLIENNQQKK